MTPMHFPAHKLCAVDQEPTGLILAATGTCIQSLTLNGDQPLSIWPRDDVESSGDEESGDEGRPAKRLKLSNGEKPSLGREASEASEASIDIKVEGRPRQKGERRKPKVPDTTLPHVSHLIATSDGSHAIAITSEDKAVRVFKVSDSGKLHQVSSRPMPKKSCAISLSHDEKTILTADKFGDVYALPLHPTAAYQRKTATPQPDMGFKPSASELTVHTKGNLEALKQQQLQKQKHTRKEGPDFEHKLLLGHVSLLTDLAIATGEVNGKDRTFLLTSDRDEHIRVSRGIPQTHVIHSFCLGHTEFVSKLFIVPWDRRVLVAGSGEPSLRVYDWQSGQEHIQYDILEHLRGDIESALSSERSTEKLAISGLCNILGVVHLRKQNVVVVSVDTAHSPGSYNHYRAEPLPATEAFRFFGIRRGEVMSTTLPIEGVCLEPSSDATFAPESMPTDSLSTNRKVNETEARAKYEKTYSVLGELIYGLENLRKRRGKAAEDEDDAADGGEVELEGPPDIDKVSQ
ncbi:tRNA (guanine-N(7)-)-methyltransferase non-catalytic subunit trm82 [Exophiala xenobiotica]|uniref:tRNA (Guanine-N(7)-)-methyltransferase non-catalytic subunit trm82 n=1 Tax=Lithohypha guttulata TaxID=1690604 RepID=A0ABR0KP89_9EURO|nr:tRNA (guanine-N(7)-)-methyltransferase non-catalytic subunit trm82 [Lithohypha guttulata]KAK5330837.1 tRNA (guanine-N(7)-)-methyltransferase non-catalytic subunit trm82 [Exophiala xenobiotica]